MIHLKRLPFMFLICLSFFGCIFIETYPEEWPKISTNERNECPNISGVYKNKNSDNGVSLAGVLIKGWYGNKYFSDIDAVTIFQSIDSIDVSVHLNNNLVDKRKLLFNQDIFCKETKVSFSKSGFGAEDVVMGFQKNKFTFQIAENGSLIMHTQSSAIGTICLFPIIGTQGKYHLFEKI